MNIKAQFPDEAALRQHLRSDIASYVQRVRDSVGPLEAEYQKQRKRRYQGIAFMVAAGVVLCFVMPMSVGVVSGVSQAGWPALVLFLSSLVATGLLLRAGWRKFQGTSATIIAFHAKLNTAVFPLVFEIFGLLATRTKETRPDFDGGKKPNNALARVVSGVLRKFAQLLAYTSPEQENVRELLDRSELITESRNQVTIDDMVTTRFNHRTLQFAEIDVKHTTGSGKNRHTKHIFHGYFVSFDLSRPLAGKTFVSAEGDSSGFGHQSFFATKQNEGLEVTKLEWNDFEELLHVVTNNPIEARYILTPDFMADLHDWWVHKKQSIRISFIDSKMYLLFPDKQVRMGQTVKRINAEQMQSYLESISLPLLHVLHLIEDVRQ